MNRPASKADQATALLSEQRKGLEQAISYWSQEDDPYSVQKVREARTQLARVASWEADMERAPEQFAGQVLGFMGKNGWGPLIDLIIRDVPVTEQKELAA